MQEYSQRPESKKRNKKYNKERRKKTIFKLSHSLSSGVNISLKRYAKQGLRKNKRHWEDLVGYSVQELKRHLENLFLSGMNWNNYGSWHIDHIIPISFFEYTSTDDIEFKYCWSLINLQPLWAKDNLEKSNKIILNKKPPTKLMIEGL